VIVEQIYTNCLAEAAYYIESNGEVAIIDPLRETTPYISKASGNGAKIKYVFETHFHADFVSGHLELASKTGAKIVFGPNAGCGFDCYSAKDGEVFKVGNITITAIHTPGHTMESTTYLLRDENGKEYCIFTGDTLFIGDVGRPDLAVKSDLTVSDLAEHLYDSLRNKIMPLPKDIIVYPAHGAGSACGKNMSKETFDTLGHQIATNYALQDMSKADFIQVVTDGLNPPPAYFPANVAMNRTGAEDLDAVLKRGTKALSATEFETAITEQKALVLDTRDAQIFAKGFVRSSLNIGVNGQFAPWVGALINNLNTPILLVAEADKVNECVTRLARVGYDNTIGYLSGGISEWLKAGKKVDTIASISAEEFAQNHCDAESSILDVRRPSEFETEHVSGAQNNPLDYIYDWVETIPKNNPYFVHCAGGYRSMIAASILKQQGVNNITEIAGGYGAIKSTDVPKTTSGKAIHA
jgi:glyoxylase-like metal-dependent hydrolase (beta-lactamase superfamily II)/rhodanese-related sulfurtransferase